MVVPQTVPTQQVPAQPAAKGKPMIPMKLIPNNRYQIPTEDGSAFVPMIERSDPIVRSGKPNINDNPYI